MKKINIRKAAFIANGVIFCYVGGMVLLTGAVGIAKQVRK